MTMRAEFHFTPRPKAIGHFLVNDPTVRNQLLTVANEIATLTKANLNSLGWSNRGVIYPRYAGHKWSAKPDHVATGVKVKDYTRQFPLNAPGFKAVGETRVALVVSDHPYAKPYEFGGLGIQSSRPMTKAMQLVKNKHGLKKR